MRKITIPKPFPMPQSPNQYTWRQLCADFIFFDVRWMSEDWKPAFDRVSPLASAKDGDKVTVTDQDWEKLCQSLIGSNERMRPDLRMDLLRMSHALTCAPVVQEEQQEAAPS